MSFFVNRNVTLSNIVAGDLTINGLLNILGGLIVEVRDSDPDVLLDGRIYLRSDL